MIILALILAFIAGSMCQAGAFPSSAGKPPRTALIICGVALAGVAFMVGLR